MASAALSFSKVGFDLNTLRYLSENPAAKNRLVSGEPKCIDLQSSLSERDSSFHLGRDVDFDHVRQMRVYRH